MFIESFMKRKMKYCIICFIFIGLLSYFIYGWYTYNHSYNLYYSKMNEIRSECNEITDSDSNQEKARCEFILENEELYTYKKPNFFVMLYSIITDNLNALNIILFLIVVGSSIYWINSVLKNKCLMNYYMRESNKSFLKRIFKESYSWFWVVPLAIVILIISCIMTSSFELYQGIENNVIWNPTTLQNPCLFIVVFILRICLYFLFYINVALLLSRKHRSYFTSLFSSFLVVVVLQLFYEIVLDKLYGVFGYKWLLYLNFLDIFNINDTYGLMSSLLFPSIIYVITLILVLISYKNKEKLLLDVETES